MERNESDKGDESEDTDSLNMDDFDSDDFHENVQYPEPDLTLISELLENIDRSPPAQEARILLMQHYAMCGWHDAARDQAHRILQYDSSAQEAQTCLDKRCRTSGRRGQRASMKTKAKARLGGMDTKVKGKGKDVASAQDQGASASTWRPKLVSINSPAVSLLELEYYYVDLMKNAETLLGEMRVLKDLNAVGCEEQILDLEAIANGQVSGVLRIKPLESIKRVAEAIMADSKGKNRDGLDTAVKDLEDLARWLKRTGGITERSYSDITRRPSDNDQDKVREALVKRVKALKALLPKSFQPLADSALMHADHEILHRKYVNDETMVSLDPVSDIPRANFWTSEDGYAWDMEELAASITSRKGVMRNPLSGQMFTRSDIRAIVQHPFGKGLKALQVEQSKLKRGVRQETVGELDKMAKVLLEDMTEDGKPSRLAVEAFVSYLETLPGAEQKAVDDLKVPAKDSHTGMAFDTTIGEAVNDVQANKVCSHKTGDFLAQAVKYLR